MPFGSHVNAIVIYDIVIMCDIFSFNHSILIHNVPRPTCISRCALIIYMLYYILQVTERNIHKKRNLFLSLGLRILRQLYPLKRSKAPQGSHLPREYLLVNTKRGSMSTVWTLILTRSMSIELFIHCDSCKTYIRH